MRPALPIVLRFDCSYTKDLAMLLHLNRRHSLRWMAAMGAWSALLQTQPLQAAAPGAEPWSAQDLAMAWRPGAAPAEDNDPAAFRVGVLKLDWNAQRAAWGRVLNVPSRPHGLTPDGAGGFYAVAARPGDWLVHVAANPTQPPLWLKPGSDESSTRTLNGHLLLSRDRQCLYSSETTRSGGAAWLVRRNAQTLKTESAWRLPGVDAHQLLFDTDERYVLIALGGVPRDERGRRLPARPMEPALLRVDTTTGEVTRRWTLGDPRLSVRHMAWSVDGDRRLLGIALQAQHDERHERLNAPLLAVWDGDTLSVPPCPTPNYEGYAGDICAGPGGSFLLSAQRSGRALLWHPDAPDELTSLGELKEVCALSGWRDANGAGLLMGAGRGLARWQANQARMLPWPETLAPDNHIALL